MANVVPSQQLPPQQPAAVFPVNHFPTTSITLKSPLRYEKVSKACKESNVTLKRHETNIFKGLLYFYGLPLPQAPPLADGLKFELHTLPVEAKAVADGDTVTVYVSTSNTRESSRVPQEVQMAAVERNEACADRNYDRADALVKIIKDAGYRVLHINNEDILARKYRIRLRGTDAPESSMPYGKEAKDELVKIIDGSNVEERACMALHRL